MSTPDVNLTPITIDTRELAAHPHMGDFFRAEGIPFVTATLDCGDYVFAAPFELAGKIPTIGIEVCTVSDLVGKVDSGRLSYQLGNMIKKYDVPYLLIQGEIRTDRDGYVVVAGRQIMRAKRLNDILHGAQAHGVIVMQDEDPNTRLASIIRYWHRPCDSHNYFRPNAVIREISTPIGLPLDQRVQFLMGCPGIGEDRAQAAINHFGSLLIILTAPDYSLQKIPGWGKKTAENFRQFIDRLDAHAIY